MTEEYGLLEVEEDAAAGDEWEELDVADTEADRIARTQDGSSSSSASASRTPSR